MEEKELYLLITRYLSNTTSTEENEVLADWLAADKKNEQTFEEIKLIWLGYQRSADAESMNALDRLHSRIAAEQPALAPARWHRFNRYITAAAAVIVIAAGWFAFESLRAEGSAIYLSVNTTSGQKKKLTLEDGTKVILGPESSLSYPKSFDDANRKVSITGEAFFEVSKNPHRPFIVQTAAMNVQVLGTHFNISAGKSDAVNTVSLFEGKVRVKLKDEQSEEYMLKPGQELSVNRHTQRVFQDQLDSASVLGWLNNVLIFKNEELGEVAPRIEKMYGVKIVFTDQATADTKLYAMFNNQALTEVMNTICASGTLAYHREGNKIYIKSKSYKEKSTSTL
ncbi:FecR domain-containing protein [Pedobacter sp. MC2016-15]|uniref:FecR family protein n=1 Tax=Pedobacter sp. MC2016-15 TaxID=2994473 RepID=UPI002245EF4F|nr:FecR family protein [Pedobacter sp. MC2016-15]MCX2479067.1 FecR domain-containing protein [Pedobacter sp. MC2016-15]